MEHDLDQLRIVIAGELDGTDIVLAHMATFPRHFGGEPDSRVGLGVVGSTITVGGDLRVIELGEVLAEIGMGRQAIVAAVDLGECSPRVPSPDHDQVVESWRT